MDGNALIITVAMCFLGNLRGCSLVKYIELELVTIKPCPATLLQALAGWPSVLR